jgi:hypothetical protein
VIDALYLPIVTLATLGFGDIVPHDPWLRLAVPVQALVGFAQLTAAMSWVLQVYPALTRRRALAIRLSLLSRSGICRLLEREESSLAATILEDLTTEVVPARGRLTQYAETYYFRDGDEETSLPAMFGVAADLTDAATRSPVPDVRFAGQLLSHALGDLTRVLDEQFLRSGEPMEGILQAYAAEHGPPVTRTR